MTETEALKILASPLSGPSERFDAEEYLAVDQAWSPLAIKLAKGSGEHGKKVALAAERERDELAARDRRRAEAAGLIPRGLAHAHAAGYRMGSPAGLRVHLTEGHPDAPITYPQLAHGSWEGLAELHRQAHPEAMSQSVDGKVTQQ